ncbi:MAG: ABC transporter ATP-binding protein/permease [Gammaproteobacteria bacterium]
MRGQHASVSYKDTNWRIINRLWPYLKTHCHRIGLALMCLIGAKIASVGLPFILKHIIDALDQHSNTHSSITLPLGLLLAYGVTRFSSVLFGELRDTLFGRVTERAMHHIGLHVFEHLHRLDLAFHLDRQTGGLSRDIERGTNGISFLLRFMVFNIVPTLLEIGLVVALLWWQYHFIFAGIVLSAVTLYIGFSVFTTEWRTRFLREVNQAESQSSTRAVDSLLNHETVKLFTNEHFECQRYDAELTRWEHARRQNRLSLFALNGGQALIIAAALTTALIIAGKHVAAGTMSLGDFVLINSFMIQIFMPLNFLGFVYREVKGSLASIEKMLELLAITPRISDAPHAPDLHVTHGDIQFDHVSFQYTADRDILRQVSFRVPAKQKVAIVGASGAGKSTLFKLLFRFYDVTQGEIRIDDQPIHRVNLHSLRRAIGVIPQDTVLFNTSIWENIRYGRVDATDSAVQEAIRLAHLDQFIEQLPNGRNTLVGERGLKLSGGEKQRVAIARALLKKPPSLIFDEATSSLDSHSEQVILQALQEMAHEQTTLVIAHRLSTVIDADHIIVLAKGQIVEQGTHRSLLQQHGQYHKLWTLQQHTRHDSKPALP